MYEFIQSADESVTRFFQGIHIPFIDTLMIVLTYLGENGIIWILAALLLIALRKTRKGGITLGISLILCVVFGNLLLKNIIARARPFSIMEDIKLLIGAPTDYSFPSGHTMASFASATTLLGNFRNRYKWIAAAGGVLAILISFSRIYLCVHFLSDVLAGVFFGILFGIAAILIVEYAGKRFSTKKKK